MKFIVVVLFLAQVAFLGSNGSPLTLPTPCHKSNPQLNKCLSKFFYKSAQALIEGSPEHHIPRMDPLEIEVLRVHRSLNDFIDVNAVFRNIQVFGMRNFELPEVKFDPETLSMEASVTFPSLSVALDYNVTASMREDVYHNEGNLRAKITNIVSNINLSMEEIDRDGVTHFGLKTLKADLTADDGFIKVVTKTREDQFIADIATSYINSNAKRVLEMLKPLASEYWDAFMQITIARGFEEFTAEQLLVA